MDAPESPANADAQSIVGRRSTRLNLSVPIVVSGKDTYGQPFRENSRATVMNAHGAKILTFHHLALGSELTIENRPIAATAQATVVWLGERKFPKDLGEAGVQLTEPGNIWGIDVPPEDWVEGVCGGEAAHSTEELTSIAAQRKAGTEAKGESGASAEEGHLTPDQIGAALDVALDKFSKRLQDAAEMQAALYEARVVKLTNQIGARVQTSADDIARGFEEKVAAAQEKHVGNIQQHLQSSRVEADALTTRLQELQRDTSIDLERAKQDIQQACNQAVQTTTQELSAKLQKESDSSAAHFVEETRKRLQDESTHAIGTLANEANSRLPRITEEYFSKSEPEIQARHARSVEEASNKVNEAAQAASAGAIEKLQGHVDELRKEFESDLGKSAQNAQEKSGKEISEHIRKSGAGISEELLAGLAKDLQKQAADFKGTLSEELKSTVKAQAEDAKKRLTALTHATVESLNKEGNAGLEEFRKHLHKTLKEIQEKEVRHVEKHVEDAAKKQGEHVQQQIEKDAGALAEKLHGEMPKAIADLQEKTLADIQAKLQGTIEQQLAEATAKLSKQADENLALISAHLTEKKQQMVNEAEEAFRGKLAEVFSSMLQPGAKKAP